MPAESSRTKLGLGGHSFIRELGNDPEASFAEQCAIVASCLDNGIRWLDTTYYQERVALGRILHQLGRRNEALLTAWNFFRQPGQEEALVGFTTYQANHLAAQLAELQTDYIDLLVLHSHDDWQTFRAEMELARRWREEGMVKQIGLGMARREHLDRLPQEHPFTHLLAPYNAFNTEASALFEEGKARGFTMVAMSPFVRGWNFAALGGDVGEVASCLLRWVTSQESVDTVIVSMRRPEWIEANLEAERDGPLTPDEATQLQTWITQAKESLR